MLQTPSISISSTSTPKPKSILKINKVMGPPEIIELDDDQEDESCIKVEVSKLS